MKRVDIVQLILFIFFGVSIYCYMGNMLATEEYPFKPMIYMKAQEAYAIRNLVQDLEDFWQVKYKKVILQEGSIGYGCRKKFIAMQYNGAEYAFGSH
jgi:hypothetical protein